MIKVLVLLVTGSDSDVLGGWWMSWVELEVVDGLGKDVGLHAFRSQVAELGCSVVSDIVASLFLLVSQQSSEE